MNDWEKAILEGTVIAVSPNQEMAKSLAVSSLKTIKIIERIELNKENGFFIVINYYGAVLELLHALLCKEGYKVLDHLSIGFYIRDILKNQEIFHIFDKYRKIRHGILYYGKNLDLETARQGISDLKRTYTSIRNLTDIG